MAESATFEEQQGFRQWWIWATLILLLLFFIYALLSQLFLGQPVGDNPMPNWMLIGVSIFIIALILTFGRLILKTRIDKKGIVIHFGMLGQHQFKWKEIRTVKVARLSFTGYGIRMTKNYGQVFRTGGKHGLQMTLKDGRKVAIGTDHPTEMKAALRKLGKI